MLCSNIQSILLCPGGMFLLSIIDENTECAQKKPPRRGLATTCHQSHSSSLIAARHRSQAPVHTPHHQQSHEPLLSTQTSQIFFNWLSPELEAVQLQHGGGVSKVHPSDFRKCLSAPLVLSLSILSQGPSLLSPGPVALLLSAPTHQSGAFSSTVTGPLAITYMRVPLLLLHDLPINSHSPH